MAQIETELYNHSINDHYTKRYIKIIQSLQTKNVSKEKNHHSHHILPRSIYPQYSKNCPWNIVYVTPREHYILHWVLSKALGGSMMQAYYQMTIHPKYQIKTTSRQYERIRDIHAKDMSERKFYIVNRKVRRLHPTNILVTSGEASELDLKEAPWVKKRIGIPNPAHSNKTSCYNTETGINELVSTVDIDYEKYIPCGLLRNQESRDKTSKILSNRAHYYHPETRHQIFVYEGEEPNGYLKGIPKEITEKMSNHNNRTHIHNKITGELARVGPDTKINEPWEWGRGPSFNNPFTGYKISTNLITSETKRIPKDERYPRYHGNVQNNGFYTYHKGAKKFFSSSWKAIKEISGHKFDKEYLVSGDIDKVFAKGTNKGKCLRDLGLNKIPINEWDTNNDEEWEWVS